jgi:uncharacterized protein (TIGR02271 family)
MAYESTTGTTSNRTITAFFDRREDAEEAVSRLVTAGISSDRIRLVPGQDKSAGTGTSSSYSAENEGGFWDALKDLFLPDEDRHTYAEGLRRGGYLVTVMAGTSEYDTALDILDDEGTIDVSERESAWRSEGWTGYEGRSGRSSAAYGSSASGLGATQTGLGTAGYSARTGTSGTEEVIPVVDEELRVGKRDVSHGRVRVRSYVVETPVSEQVNLREEDVSIQRRPVDRAVSGDEGLFRDRTIELEEHAEEAVVAKEARVREELVINKDVRERTETISDTVRHTEVEVDDDRATGSSGVAGRTDRTRTGF